MTRLMWTPSADHINASNMTAFMQRVNPSFEDYDALYAWSIDHREQFWEALWTFCDITPSHPYTSVLVEGKRMQDARWFPDATLNYAEHLLKRRDTHPALIACNENGRNETLTYNALYKKVAELASALQSAGIQAGDHIAAWMPNIPETVIALLASSSIGAVFSSCSPEFGVPGVLERFKQIEPKILLVADGHYYNGKAIDARPRAKAIAKALPTLEHVVLVPYLGTTEKTMTAWDDFIDHTATDIKFTALPFDHPLYILFSSGTTGAPKCMVHRAGGVLLQHLKEHRLHTNITPDDRLFYYTTTGWMMWNWLVSVLASDATAVLYDGSPFYPNINTLFDLTDTVGITVFGTSASYIAHLQKEKARPRSTHSCTTLNTLLSTGSPLAPSHFDYVYTHIKQDLCLASITGGSDIVSCFALGNPNLPVYRGEIQCRGLGMDVQIFNEDGKPVHNEKGELVCTQSFPSMPLTFWNDPDGQRYAHAYFDVYPNTWAHGDYAILTETGGLIMEGRSDTVLNPHGVRIGTAEIYNEVAKVDEVVDSIVVGQRWEQDIRIILFVVLRPGLSLSEELIAHIKATIRSHTSPHHVPKKIIQIQEVPRTFSGKIVELAVQQTLHGEPVKNKHALANPEALEQFQGLTALNH